MLLKDCDLLSEHLDLNFVSGALFHLTLSHGDLTIQDLLGLLKLTDCETRCRDFGHLLFSLNRQCTDSLVETLDLGG